MDNPKITTSYENRILTITFHDKAVISVSYLRDIYDEAYKKSKTQKFCVIFHALGHYTVKEEALHYMVDNPSNEFVLAKAYVLDSEETVTKTVKHLEEDKPQLKPQTFKILEAAKKAMYKVVVMSMI